MNVAVGGERISVLVALSDRNERAELLGVLKPTGWRVEAVSSLEQAIASLRRSKVAVIVTQFRPSQRLSWLDLLNATWRFEPAPRVIVTDRLADESMWAEVLNLGAFDLLMQPFVPEEVVRVIGHAWRSWSVARRGAA